jgi:hypothetical protein
VEVTNGNKSVATRRVGVVLSELFDNFVPSLVEEYRCWELLMFLVGNPVGDFNKRKALGFKAAQGEEREKLIREAINAIFDWIESRHNVIVPERYSEIKGLRCCMTLYSDWCEKMELKWLTLVFEGILCKGCPFCRRSEDLCDRIVYCESLYIKEGILEVDTVSDRNPLMPWQCPVVAKGKMTEEQLFAKVQEGGRTQRIYYFKQQVQRLKNLYAEEKIEELRRKHFRGDTIDVEETARIIQECLELGNNKVIIKRRISEFLEGVRKTDREAYIGLKEKNFIAELKEG